MSADTPDTYTHTHFVRRPPTQADVDAIEVCLRTNLAQIDADRQSRRPVHAAIEDGLRAMIAQIDADRKARPVHAAIEATHHAYRSNGQPPRYYDPLLKD